MATTENNNNSDFTNSFVDNDSGDPEDPDLIYSENDNTFPWKMDRHMLYFFLVMALAVSGVLIYSFVALQDIESKASITCPSHTCSELDKDCKYNPWYYKAGTHEKICVIE